MSDPKPPSQPLTQPPSHPLTQPLSQPLTQSLSRTLSQPPLSRTLYKQKSWSPDASREEVYLKRQASYNGRHKSSKSVTDEDLEELKACIELGFGFENDSPDLNPKLTETLPALELYCAFNRQYGGEPLSRSGSSSSILTDGGSSTSSMFDSGGDRDREVYDQNHFKSGDREEVKAKLRQWAQLVACSVKQFGGESPRTRRTNDDDECTN